MATGWISGTGPSTTASTQCSHSVGDGVVNEVLNGILRDGPGREVPALGVIPRRQRQCLFPCPAGFPTIRSRRPGSSCAPPAMECFAASGLGHVTTPEFTRWFAVNAGLGMDAQIIASMEQQRTRGHRATPLRYFVTTVREYFGERDGPEMKVTRPGSAPAAGVVLGIVQNASPWTYFGALPIDPCPHASFETGLDLFALRNLGPLTTVRAAARMLSRTDGASTRSSIVRLARPGRLLLQIRTASADPDRMARAWAPRGTPRSLLTRRPYWSWVPSINQTFSILWGTKVGQKSESWPFRVVSGARLCEAYLALSLSARVAFLRG